MRQIENSIPEGWIESTLGEVIERITKGTTPKSFDSELESVNYIKSDSLSYEGSLDNSKFVEISKKTNEQLKRSQLKENDILLSMAGAYLGKTGIVKKEFLPANTNQAVAIITVNSNKIIYSFLWYKLRKKTSVQYFNTIPSQSAQPNINFQEIKSLSINLPPLPEQKAIAKVLTSFDDKIENLRAQNKTLEQTAQTLFKEWFGNYQISDELPEGWRFQSFYSIGDFINGSAFKNSDFSDNKEGLAIIKIAELKNGITESTAFTKKDVDPKYLINDYDILFSWSGSPETSIDIFLWTEDKAILNQHTFNVRIKDEKMKAWYYFLLKYHKPLFVQLAKMKQTTGLGHVTISNLKEYMFVFPPKSILEKKATLFTTFYKKLASNKTQIQSLTQTRDTLLPKLMRGEIRVNEFKN